MRQRAELRDYLAAERTLLAWIRTGLALMGFGFVVARFGLFLQEIQVAQPTFSAHSYGLSLWFGTALIAAGVVVNLISGWQYSRLVRDLDRGQQTLHRPPALAVAISLFLALVGLAMTIYLISLRGSAHSNSGNNSRQNEEMLIAPTADKRHHVYSQQSLGGPDSGRAQGYFASERSHGIQAGRAYRRSGKGGLQQPSVFAGAARLAAGVARSEVSSPQVAILQRGSGKPMPQNPVAVLVARGLTISGEVWRD